MILKEEKKINMKSEKNWSHNKDKIMMKFKFWQFKKPAFKEQSQKKINP